MLKDDREKYVVGGIAKLLSKATQKGVKDYGDVKSKIKNKPKPKERDYDPAYYYTTSEKKEMMVDMLVEKGYSPKEIQVLLDDVYKKGNSNKMIKALDLENVNEDAYVQSTGFHPYYEAMEVKNRKKKNEGGSMDDQMIMVMTPPMQPEMESDDNMEDGYTKFIMEEALTEEEEDMLTSKLEQDEELQMLFDKVIDVAQEFAGSGPVEGPGSGVSDSIPARLSDGEFVFTAKAVEEIGEDTLMSMMKDAEAQADERQGMQDGGMFNKVEEEKVDQFGKPIDSDIARDELKKSMLSVNPRYQ